MGSLELTEGSSQIRGLQDRRRRRLFKVVTVCLSVVTSLAILEGAARVLGIAPALPEQYRDFIEDPYLPFRRRPNVFREARARPDRNYVVQTNSEGFRDREHSPEKPDGVFRILALGDSFTWGVGAAYEETYLYRLEELLNARGTGHKEVEIIKAGVPRYFPEIERVLLEHCGVRYNPDLIMVAFAFNDVKDTAMGLDALRPTSKEGYLVSRRSERIGRLGTCLYIHSHVARFLIIHYLAGTESADDGPVPGKLLTPDQAEKAWRKVEEEYDRMKRIAESHDAAFVLAAIPFANLDPTLGRHLAELMEHKVDAFVDTQPALKATRRRTGRLLYWPKDGHCDREGYEVIARTLFAELTGRKLVP